MAGELVRMSEFSSSTPVRIPLGDGGTVEMSVNDVLRWLHPEAPPPAAFKFLVTCAAHAVNPMLGEAHLVQMGGQWVTVVDKSGWIRKAEDRPEYDGFEAGITIQSMNPTTKVRGEPRDITGSSLPHSHVVSGGWAKVYRKDRSRPTEARVSMMEYRRENTPNWQKMPCTMIRKVALVHALRESGLVSSGAYDSAEMPDYAPAVPDHYRGELVGESMAIEAEVIEPVASADLVGKLHELRAAIGIPDQAWAAILAKRGVSSASELTDMQATAIINNLQRVLDNQRAGETLLPDPAPATDPPAATEAEAEATGHTGQD